MPPPSASSHWECHKCHCWAPRGGKAYCNSCGHSPPAGVTEKRDAQPKRTPKAKPKARVKAKADDDHRHSAAKKAMAAKDRRIAGLQKELDAAKAAAAAATPPGPAESEAMDLQSGATVGLDNEVCRARDELTQMQGFTEFHKSLIPNFEDKLKAAHAKLEDATAARRAANPLREQIEKAEAFQARAAKRLAEAKSCLVERQQGLAEAQRALEEQQAAVAEAEATVTKAGAEVAALAARYASERADTAPGATIAIADPSAANPSGFVSVAYAEEKWAEREVAFNQQLAQLQALVAAKSEAPSEAGDPELDLFEEDETWNKVERGKRKSLLRKERDALATRVRAGLGKVSSAASPFKKG